LVRILSISVFIKLMIGEIIKIKLTVFHLILNFKRLK